MSKQLHNLIINNNINNNIINNSTSFNNTINYNSDELYKILQSLSNINENLLNRIISLEKKIENIEEENKAMEFYILHKFEQEANK